MPVEKKECHWDALSVELWHKIAFETDLTLRDVGALACTASWMKATLLGDEYAKDKARSLRPMEANIDDKHWRAVWFSVTSNRVHPIHAALELVQTARALVENEELDGLVQAQGPLMDTISHILHACEFSASTSVTLARTARTRTGVDYKINFGIGRVLDWITKFAMAISDVELQEGQDGEALAELQSSSISSLESAVKHLCRRGGDSSSSPPSPEEAEMEEEMWGRMGIFAAFVGDTQWMEACAEKAGGWAVEGTKKYSLLHAAVHGGRRETEDSSTEETVAALIAENRVSLEVLDARDQTPLALACSLGNVGAARLLLEAGSNANATDSDGVPVLHLAVTGAGVGRSAKSVAQALEIVGLLLEREEVDVNGRCGMGDTPLVNAVTERCLEMVQLLLACDRVNVNATGDMYVTPLITACYAGKNKDIVDALLEAGADATLDDDSNVTPLHAAVMGRNLSVVQTILDTEFVDVNAVDDMGETAIMSAAQMGKADIFQAILDTGKVVVDPQAPRGDAEMNLLHAACMGGSPQIVKAVVETWKGWDLEAKTGNNETVLHLACIAGDPATLSIILETLLAAGPADELCYYLNAVDDDSTTPLLLAASEGVEECMRLLLEASRPHNSIDLTCVDMDGNNVFFRACEKDAVGMFPILIQAMGHEEAQALLEATSHDKGDTLVHKAAEEGAVKVMEYLFDKAVFDTFDLQNSNGHTPLHTAAEWGQPETITFLLEKAGLDVDVLSSAKFSTSITPLALAVQEGYDQSDECVQVLLKAGADPSPMDNVEADDSSLFSSSSIW